MTTRKTLRIADAIATANAMLAASPDDYDRERSGIASFLEALLHDADAYRGFGYLPTEWNAGGTALRDDYDDTRRRYIGGAA